MVRADVLTITNKFFLVNFIFSGLRDHVTVKAHRPLVVIVLTISSIAFAVRNHRKSQRSDVIS